MAVVEARVIDDEKPLFLGRQASTAPLALLVCDLFTLATHFLLHLNVRLCRESLVAHGLLLLLMFVHLSTKLLFLVLYSGARACGHAVSSLLGVLRPSVRFQGLSHHREGCAPPLSS